MAKSTKFGRKSKSRQSAKPYLEFPLTAHPSGRWCKKRRGKQFYFGRIDADGDSEAAWKAALERYKREWPYILDGREPPPEGAEDGLTHPHEEIEKMLLAVGERLNLRGPDIDKLNEASLKAEQDQTVKAGLEGIKGMTLSVIDGNFPREVLASRNLTFSPYKMPTRRNKREFYDAKTFKPSPVQPGVIHSGAVSLNVPPLVAPQAESAMAATDASGNRNLYVMLLLGFAVGLTLVVRRGMR